MSAVADDHFAAAGSAVGSGEGEIRLGEGRPTGFVLDAKGVASEVGRLDQSGADPAHWVKDHVAWVGEGGDGLASEGGQHLAGVGGGLGQVADPSLLTRG